jgi:hypothetical protein
MKKLAKKVKREIRAKNGNYVGVLIGNVLHKRVQGSKHKFRKIGDNGSWGIDYDVVYKDVPETTVVRVFDTETQTTYQTPIKKYKEKGIILHFKENTADHYVQVFLPVEEFMRTV